MNYKYIGRKAALSFVLTYRLTFSRSDSAGPAAVAAGAVAARFAKVGQMLREHPIAAFSFGATKIGEIKFENL